MTRASQKALEREYLDRFRGERPDWLEVIEREMPEFRIQRTDGRDIALRVVATNDFGRACPMLFAAADEAKEAAALDYPENGAELWLLIVCETQGDLESHLFPRDQQEVEALHAKIRDSGFDFATGPFAQVWLMSAFTGEQLRLYPSAAISLQEDEDDQRWEQALARSPGKLAALAARAAEQVREGRCRVAGFDEL